MLKGKMFHRACMELQECVKYCLGTQVFIKRVILCCSIEIQWLWFKQFSLFRKLLLLLFSRSCSSCLTVCPRLQEKICKEPTLQVSERQLLEINRRIYSSSKADLNHSFILLVPKPLTILAENWLERETIKKDLKLHNEMHFLARNFSQTERKPWEETQKI